MARRRPARLIHDYLESREVTQGSHYGERLKVLRWQSVFLTKTFNAPAVEIALSMARANGKTTFVAGIAAASLQVPELRQPRAETLVLASSFGQARIDFDHTLAFMGPAVENKKIWNVLDNSN